MTFSWRRVRAIAVKELRDYRRNHFIVATMTALPLIFITLPLVQVFNAFGHLNRTNLNLHVGLSMLYMLLIPAFMPSTLSAYAIVGEREQGTLEAILITPIRREELLIGKALAALIPTLAIAYAVFGIFLAAAALFAQGDVVSAIFSGTHVLVQLLFTPLLAGWGIWVGIAVSTRSRDVRVAQQLSTLGTLPIVAVLALMSLNILAVSAAVAIAFAAALLVIDLLAWRVVASWLDRERLVSGERGRRSRLEAPTAAVTNFEVVGAGARISLVRKSNVVAELRRQPFRVVLDGVDVGSIATKGTLEVPTGPGPHTLQVRIGRYSSRTVRIELADGEVAHYRCSGGVIWPLYVASLLKTDLALVLTRA